MVDGVAGARQPPHLNWGMIGEAADDDVPRNDK